MSSFFASAEVRPSYATTTTIGLSGASTAAFNLAASDPIRSVCRTWYGGRLNVVVPYLSRLKGV